MVEVFAAGNTGDRVIGAANEGYGSINSPGTAKNDHGRGFGERSARGLDGCGVGDSAANSARDILDFSSRGPTDDLRQAGPRSARHPRGRRQAPARRLQRRRDLPGRVPHGQSALLVDLRYVPGHGRRLRRGCPGSTTSERDRGAPPSPAMTKALLINSATDIAGGDNGKGEPPTRPERRPGLGPRERRRRGVACRVSSWTDHDADDHRHQLSRQLRRDRSFQSSEGHAGLDRRPGPRRPGTDARQQPGPGGVRRRPEIPRQRAVGRYLASGRLGRYAEQRRERAAPARHGWALVGEGGGDHSRG